MEIGRKVEAFTKGHREARIGRLGAFSWLESDGWRGKSGKGMGANKKSERGIEWAPDKGLSVLQRNQK